MHDIDHLIVIAGVSCVGKTRFLDQLGTPQLPPLPDGWQALDLKKYTIRNAMDVTADGASGSVPRHMILHYDIFRPITFYGTLDFGADPAAGMLRAACKTSVVTFWEQPQILLERSVGRRRRLWRKKLLRKSSLRQFGTNYRGYLAARSRREAMRPWFSDPERLWDLHAAWFKAVSDANVSEHWVARSAGEGGFHALGSDIPRAPLWALDDPPPMQRSEAG